MAEDVAGQEEAWSSVDFAAPVASESGTLFVVVQYPSHYVPPDSGSALGVGFSLEAPRYPHFVTGDGEAWIRVTSSCRVLLEPILAERIPGAVTLRGPQTEPDPSREAPRPGLVVAPNPFNPQTRIELTLAAATTGTVRVYDLRGCLVTELHRGVLAQGANMFVWDGRDGRGRPVASAPYWVQARMDDQQLTRKVLLLK